MSSTLIGSAAFRLALATIAMIARHKLRPWLEKRLLIEWFCIFEQLTQAGLFGFIIACFFQSGHSGKSDKHCRTYAALDHDCVSPGECASRGRRREPPSQSFRSGRRPRETIATTQSQTVAACPGRFEA